MIISDATVEAYLDSFFGGATFTPAATLYLGLLITPPNSDGTGYAEPAEGSYARVAKTNNSTNFPACTPGTRQKSNGTVITFPTAGGIWGSVDSIGIFSSVSGGDCLWRAPKPAPEAVGTGNVVNIGVGQLKFTAVS